MKDVKKKKKNTKTHQGMQTKIAKMFHQVSKNAPKYQKNTISIF